MPVLQWEPQTPYNVGDVVKYQGVLYKVIQAHTSQSDWTPPIVPALFERLPEDANLDNLPPPPPPSDGQYGKQKTPDLPFDENKADVQDHEKKSEWSELDPTRQKEIEAGGGLLLGLAAVGAGYALYKHREYTAEEKKTHLWALQNWLQEAKERTDDFNQNGAKGPLTWILTSGKNIPHGALLGGQDKSGQALYIARAYYDGGLQLGKAGTQLKEGGLITANGKEIDVVTFEILLADQTAIKWVDASGTPSDDLVSSPPEGGHEADGTELYIAQAPFDSTVQPGKTSKKLKGAIVGYALKEELIPEYRILALA